MLDRFENLSGTEAAIVAGAVVVFLGYALFILAPAWTSYGRLWERFAAAFLTLFILATMVGIGVGIGLGLVWSYDRWG